MPASLMMHCMRTTTDLPPLVYKRVRQIAASQQRSVSSVIADLTLRGLAQVETPVRVSRDAATGLPLLSIERTVTDEDVARMLDDE